jgi:hypothetical protein
MAFERSLVVPLLLVLAAGCSNSSGGGVSGEGAGSSGSSGGSSSGGTGSDDASAENGADATGGSSSSGGATGGDGSRSSSSGSSGAGSSGSGSGSGGSSGAGGALAGGTAAVTAFCTAGCDRASTCAAMAGDAGAVNVTTCTSTCETENGGEETLYRSDYWAADTSCVASASCTDTLSGTASANCSASALQALTPDTDVVSFCSTVENQSADGGCLAPAGCLSTYKVLSDATVQALAACIASPTFCTDTDAGAGCFAAALTP